MAAVDPLNISPFFSVSDGLQRKKKKEEKITREKSDFTEILAHTEKIQEAQTESEIGNLKIAGAKIPSNASFDDVLTELVDDVYTAGDALKKNPFTDTFIVYKQKLSRFMQFVIQNAYEMEVRERRKGKKRQQLITIQTINAKLDSLAADILYNQADQLKILAKIEEINGLLVDFLS
ncbi:YaaR family protein [Treponema sp. OMZ 840]|uniref:DUF327 family protein n=1 Tax=Treponema sp. OMZ 840 TaxID=244313 RepID=UPI003D8D19C3